jgi:NAD(P)-dependent dehydrogenase (short-subunit alcohol dehydrogenase family)
LTFAIYPSLAGRNVFISGGATGIGADLVRAFARNHARIAFVDVQRAEGEATAALVKAEGGTALFLNCDVTDVVALQASIAEARAKLGPVAVLVNNAANDERHAVADVTADYWDHAQSIKLTLLGEDIARMALFLGSDDSRMVTKQSIIVDAGLR